jgi:uncharacterized protein YbjT (DUF2867 family)
LTIPRRALLIAALSLLSACAVPNAPPLPVQVLVFGGTGMIGVETVKALVLRGADVTLFVRADSDLAPLAGLPVKTAVGDALQPQSIAAAFHAHRYDAVISAIARTDHDKAVTATTVYATGNDNITRAARAAGIRQMILVGSVGSGDSGALVPPKLREFARIVFEDKTEAENTLIASGIHYTIIRTGILLLGEASGTGVLSEDHTLSKPMRIGEGGRVVGACAGDRACYDHIYHTVDPSIPDLSPEQLEAERKKLGAYKLKLRASREQRS